MKNNEYEAFEKSLFDKGYKRHNWRHHINDDFHFYKTLVYKTDNCGDKTAELMITFVFWNWSKYPVEKDHDPYGVEAEILLTRTFEESVYLNFGQTTVLELGIDEIENIARKFHKFSEKNIKVTRG